MPYTLPDPEPTLEFYEEPRLHLQKFLSLKLVEFDISPRILFPLADNGIITIGDLVRRHVRDLRKIRNLGVTSINVLRRFVFHHKLHFGMKQG